MSLLDLKSLLGNEDFADAHEPLNDGVKAVPNAQTVAASVKTGDVGKDINTQGPAKVIPEKEDTDDETKTEHNVVKESAEKSKPRSDSSGSTVTETEGGEKSETKPGDAVTPTEDEAQPLEHNSEKEAKQDLDKTTIATKGLEAYGRNARRFDIIGHPKVKAAEVGKMIGYIHRRSGVKGDVTVSAESIDNAIALGLNRIAKLEREVQLLCVKASNENIADSMGIPNEQIDVIQEAVVTAAPTEHGAPPMDPVAAAALTEAELDPLDVPILEINRVQETIDSLEQSATALEQYVSIIRSTPRISKQAAAVLHAGLEHIDRVCELKVRSTGMESYLTTPRAAMEATEINERSLTDRAAEIGSKILNWILKMIEMVEVYVMRYTQGIASSEKWVKELQTAANSLKDGLPETTLAQAPSGLFLNGEFIGNEISEEEREVPDLVKRNRADIMNQMLRPLLAILNSGPASKEMADRIRELKDSSGMQDGERAIKLPGEMELVADGINLRVTEISSDKKADRKDFHIDAMSQAELKKNLNGIAKYLDQLNATATGVEMNSAGSKLRSAIISLRHKSKGGDEMDFQAVQSTVQEIIRDAFHPRVLFGSVLHKLAVTQKLRVNYYSKRMGVEVATYE